MTLKDLADRRFKERWQSQLEVLVNGVENFAEYRYRVGYMRGMYDLMADLEPYLKDPDSAGDDA